MRTAPDDMARAVTTAWRYGAAVVGPVLTGFAEWVVDNAEQNGTDVVWCPMREGELLSALINNAARARGRKVEARPLWLALKSGNFGGRDFFLTAFEALPG